MDDLIGPLIVLLSLQTSRVRTAYDARRGPGEGDAGGSARTRGTIARGGGGGWDQRVLLGPTAAVARHVETAGLRSRRGLGGGPARS